MLSYYDGATDYVAYNILFGEKTALIEEVRKPHDCHPLSAIGWSRNGDPVEVDATAMHDWMQVNAIEFERGTRQGFPVKRLVMPEPSSFVLTKITWF